MAHFRQTVNGATTTVVADEAPEGGEWEEVQPDAETHDEETAPGDDAGQQGFPPAADNKETGK